MSRPESDETLLDRAAAEVRDEPVDPQIITRAAARVWDRLAAEAAAPAVEAAQAESAAAATAHLAATAATDHTLRGCADIQAQIPAFLRGELLPARALLVEDHTRSCVACRRALRDAQKGQTVRTATAPAAATPFTARRRPAWMALAAALVLAVGTGILAYFFDLVPGVSADTARIESVDGTLFLVDGSNLRPLGAGDKVREGDEVRTAKGSGALLRLADGSLVELSERAALSYDVRRTGTTLQLGQGRVLVQAAKQRDRHLFVATDDCLVAVTGTIFTVNQGTKGSRVSVVEGEVRVSRSGHDTLLHPGGQVTTHASVERIPVAQEIAWSRDADRYQELLTRLTALSRDIDAQLPPPGLRTSTRLLDAAPAGTKIWIALPNLSQNLSETQRLLDQRLADDALLQQWWGDAMGSGERAQRFHEVIEKIGALGRNLGDEVAVAVTEDGPVVLAEVSDAGAFRAQLAAEAAELAGRHGKAVLTLVDDPAQAVENDTLLAWVGDGLFVASPEPDALVRAVAAAANPGANPFATTPFHAQVAAAYADGAGWLFAGDLKALLHDRAEGSSASDRTAEQLGILDLDSFLIDHRAGTERSETRAVMTFDQTRRGLASWLAAPAPMGALDYISPEANLAAAFVVKDPARMLDDLLAALPDFGASLAELRDKHGFDLQSLAATLGGEIAFAIDGPLVPQPSWKLVLEVYNPTGLQTALEDAVRKADAELVAEGKPGIELRPRTANGRTSWALVHKGQNGATVAHYLYADGYLIAAPSKALLDRALQVKASGATLAASARFQELLPADRQVNFSAVVFHSLGDVLGPLAQQAGNAIAAGSGAAGSGGPNPAAALALAGPTLTYAYGEDDRILFASNRQAGPLGFNLATLLGLGGLARLGDDLEHEGNAAAEQEAR
jgi:ferric-dicitrate binding protein FerR (iron transport regulator)